MIWSQSQPPRRPRDWEVGRGGSDARGIDYITSSTLFETDENRIPRLLFFWNVLIRPLVPFLRSNSGPRLSLVWALSVCRLVALHRDFDAKVGGESCESPAFRSRTVMQSSRIDSIVSTNTVGIYFCLSKNRS